MFSHPVWRLASLGPMATFLLVFSVIPILYLFLISFYKIAWSGGASTWTYVGLGNYRDISGATFFGASIWNTSVFAVAAVSLQVVLGFGMALLVSGLGKARVIFIGIFLIPLLVPPIVIGAMWRLIYNLDFGLINYAFIAMGIDPVNWLGDQKFALMSVIIVDVWHWTPFVFLLLLAGLEGLPEDVFEAARIDGASRWQQFRHITLPMMLPILAATILIRILMALKVFDEVFLLTSGGPGTATEVLGLSVYRTFFLEDRHGDGAALAIMVIGMVFLTGLVGHLATRRFARKEET